MVVRASEVYLVFVAQGRTHTTCKRFECSAEDRPWHSALVEAATAIFPDQNPASFHFTGANHRF